MSEGGEVGEGVERLKEAVPRIVSELFERDRRVVLLSNVGQRLRREGVDFKAILGETGLAAFIRQELAGQVELKSTAENSKVVTAYPSSIDLSQELDPAPASSRRTIPDTDRQNPANRQFVREVWYAFSHSLNEGSARYLRLKPAPTYRDIPQEETPTEGMDVPRDSIVPVGTAPAYERNKMIISNIESWAGDNGISLDEISERSRAKNGRNALDVLLQALSQVELSRILLPLDLVKSLRGKKVD